MSASEPTQSPASSDAPGPAPQPPMQTVSRTALVSGGIGSVVATGVAGYGAVTATAGEDLEIVAMIIGLIFALFAIGAMLSAARDWREATSRMESHVPLLRIHSQRLRDAPTPEAVADAELMLADAADERELLVQSGAHRQAADMAAALAELDSALTAAKKVRTDA